MLGCDSRAAARASRSNRVSIAGSPIRSGRITGYAQLRQRLDRLTQQHGPVYFVIRVDSAGQ
ncbi:MAG TPA: hypothetical protein VKD72_05105 [Gemmataceae bacterium]|nr:hypothetical protein [Gemmataceae bacterium]